MGTGVFKSAEDAVKLIKTVKSFEPPGQDDGMYYMHMVTGDAIAPCKWEEAGWTQPAPQLPGLEIVLDDVEDFTDKVMCQHYIISYGDNTKEIAMLCGLLGIEII